MNALAMVMILLGTGPLEQMDNVAPNGSFEEDQDRDTLPDGWQTFACDSPARLVWDEQVAHSGSRSLRISDSYRAGDQHDWTEMTVTATAPPEADSLRILLNLAHSRGTAWFDDVKVSGKSRPLPQVRYVFNDTRD